MKVSDLFEVYRQKLTAPEKTVIENSIEVINDLLGVKLSATACRYTPYTRTLSVHTQGALKSEILMRKKEILTHLKGRLGVAHAPQELI